jgi:methanogenic corrinoid protein MtbC1
MYKKLQLITAIADLQEEVALKLVRESLARGCDPVQLIEDCQEGMRLVGKNYENKKYCLSGLIMGGEIFYEVMGLIRPVMGNTISGGGTGKILLGTVAGDIHDLGKNIVATLLKCHNFTVYDLGIDIAPAEFLQKTRELNPDIIGLSGLITGAYDSMRETIELLRKSISRVPIIIGGSQVDGEVSRYTGADYWVTSANDGVELCKRLMSK